MEKNRKQLHYNMVYNEDNRDTEVALSEAKDGLPERPYTLNIRCRIIIGIHKGTIILTTKHMAQLTSELPRQPAEYEVSWVHREFSRI